jgi:hypothetical protein
MASSRVRMILAIALTSLLVLGCDDNPAAPRLGSFTIDPEPNSINAPWQVTGPDGLCEIRHRRPGSGEHDARELRGDLGRRRRLADT